MNSTFSFAEALNRRRWLKLAGGALLAAGSGLAPEGAQRAPSGSSISKRKFKAAVIGHTGHGDYGHGFDVIFQGVENVTLEAIADPDPAGLKRAAEKSGAKRSYANYREMLEKEKPDLVSIAPRVPELHKEMALAAIGVGAHIYMEKPFTESVADADAILRAAEAKRIKIGVGHSRRFTSDFVKIRRCVQEGFLGKVLEMRVYGKQDARAGGEDLIVLGTHDFDLMRWCFGDPEWVYASVTSEGRAIGRGDVRKGREPIWVAGDTIRAMFSFPKNVAAYWSSMKTDDDWNTGAPGREKWTFVISGTKRTLAQQSGQGAVYLDSPFLIHKDEKAIWRELPDPKEWPIAAHERHPIINLIHAIENDGKPLCSGHDGRAAIEMVSGIYESERTDGRVQFPLKDRTNPLERFSPSGLKESNK